MTTNSHSIRKTIFIDLPVEKAFDRFTNGFKSWWPNAYSWSQDDLVDIVLESTPGGRLYEIGPENFICQFGRVIKFNPPHSITFTWQISADRQPQPSPKNASEIHVHFIAENESKSKVIFEHKHIERHGESDAENYTKALDSEHGWSYILDQYANSAGK